MINNQEIIKISQLAKLNLSPIELSYYTKQIDEVIKMIDLLHQIDCSNVQPLHSVSHDIQRLREDIADKNDIFNEPVKMDDKDKNTGYYIVPKVVE